MAVGHFDFNFILLFFSEENPVCRDRTHVPTCQKVTTLPLSYRGDRRVSVKWTLDFEMDSQEGFGDSKAKTLD